MTAKLKNMHLVFNLLLDGMQTSKDDDNKPYMACWQVMFFMTLRPKGHKIKPSQWLFGVGNFLIHSRLKEADLLNYIGINYAIFLLTIVKKK